MSKGSVSIAAVSTWWHVQRKYTSELGDKPDSKAVYHMYPRGKGGKHYTLTRTSAKHSIKSWRPFVDFVRHGFVNSQATIHGSCLLPLMTWMVRSCRPLISSQSHGNLGCWTTKNISRKSDLLMLCQSQERSGCCRISTVLMYFVKQYDHCLSGLLNIYSSCMFGRCPSS